MLENVSDMISLYVLIFFVLAGLYALFIVTSAHHGDLVRRREEAYYALLDEIGNEYEEDDNDDVAVEDR
ncbi:MAG: hypothetical protein ACI32N_03260 [Bulleidia sp.]